MSKGYSEKDLVSQFRVVTGASEEDAYCYLIAEEWDLENALIYWRADSYLRKAG